MPVPAPSFLTQEATPEQSVTPPACTVTPTITVPPITQTQAPASSGLPPDTKTRMLTWISIIHQILTAQDIQSMLTIILTSIIPFIHFLWVSNLGLSCRTLLT